MIEAFFIVHLIKLNSVHDGIVLCLTHLFASLKRRLWFLKQPEQLNHIHNNNVTLTLLKGNLT